MTKRRDERGRMRILLASTNRGKIAELQRMFSSLPHAVLVTPEELGGLPEVVEDLPTFEGNAAKKAVEIATALGVAVLADDSGLEVDALGGAPGVHSARYAGDAADDRDNNAKLLAALSDLVIERRTARFRCVLAFVDLDGDLGAEPHLEHGTCEGRIGLAERGAGGFGYDPLFVVGPGGRTLAELTPQEKGSMSHRGEAARKMIAYLGTYTKRPA